MKLFYLLAVVVLFANVGCEKNKEEQSLTTTTPPTSGAAQTTPPQPVVESINVANVLLTPSQGSPILYTVEVAKTPEEKSKGLMGRENLAANHGMWFVFDDDVQDAFWMKDTPLALDIIFVDKNGKIVDIIANATPNSTDILMPHQKYRYVLEVKGGTAAGTKLNLGDKVEFRLGPP